MSIKLKDTIYDIANKAVDSNNLGGNDSSWHRNNVLGFTYSGCSSDSNNEYDANKLLEGFIYNFASTSYWKNAPSGLNYGSIINLKSGNYDALTGQLAWDINYNSTTDTTKTLWWRSIQGTNKVEYAKWHQIAFVDTLDDIYLRLSGGTMTGSITLTSGKSIIHKGVKDAGDTDGTSALYVSETNTYLGAFGSGKSTCYTYLRSTGDYLYHRAGNSTQYTDYKILTSGNSSVNKDTYVVKINKVDIATNLVNQSETTTTNYRAILFGSNNDTDTSKLTSNVTDKAYLSSKFYAQPSTGSLFVNNLYITNGGSTTSSLTSDSKDNIYFSLNSQVPLVIKNSSSEKSIRPGLNYSNIYSLGTSDSHWSTIYSGTGNYFSTINLLGTTSDTARINFSRCSEHNYPYNYITAPSGGVISIQPGTDPSSITGYMFSDTTLYPGANNTYSLGKKSTNIWLAVYATTFYGNLSGTATKATQDGSGNTITSTYVTSLGTKNNYSTSTTGVLTWTKAGITNEITIPFATETYRFKRVVDGGTSIDLNTCLPNGGFAYNYGSGGYWKNGPEGLSYGQVLQLCSGEYNNLAAQFAWDVNHNQTDSTRNLWFRANDGNNWTKSGWHQIAFMDKVLPLSGGTLIGLLKISTANWPQLILNSTTEGKEANIQFTIKDVIKGYTGYIPTQGTFLYNTAASKYLAINDLGKAHFNGNELLDKGNSSVSGGGSSWGSSISVKMGGGEAVTLTIPAKPTYSVTATLAAGSSGNAITGITGSGTTLTYTKGSFLPSAGGTLSGNLSFLPSENNSTDQFIYFRYSSTELDKYSWRIGYLSSGAGNENRFVVQNNNKGSWGNLLTFGLEDQVAVFTNTPKVGSTLVSLDGHSHSNHVTKSAYSFSSGCLVKTDIPTESYAMVTFSIFGNSYSEEKSIPIFTVGNFYNYKDNDDILSSKAIHYGNNFGKITVFCYNGYVYLWFKQTSSYQSFFVYVYTNNDTNAINRVTSISNSAIPSSGVTRKHEITPTIGLNTSNSTISTGSSNGTISVKLGGSSATDVPVKGLNAAAYCNTTTSVTSGSSNLITSGAVYTALQGKSNSHTHPYLPTAGGEMSGNITFPVSYGIIQTTANTSNYTTTIRWYKGASANSSYSYSSQIGWHNTGDTNGAITLLPYPTSTSPWEGTVGLYISKNMLKWENSSILTASNWNTLIKPTEGTSNADRPIIVTAPDSTNGGYKGLYFTSKVTLNYSTGNLKSTITTSSDIYHSVTNSNGAVGIYTSTNRGLYDFTKSTWIIATNGTNTWTNQSSGNFGIGTTSPSSKLHVSGGPILIDNNQSISGLDTGKTIRTLLSFDNANQVNLAYGAAGAGYNTYINGNNIYIRYGTARNNGIILTSGGLVGIKRTPVTYDLEVEGTCYAKTKLLTETLLEFKDTIAGKVTSGGELQLIASTSGTVVLNSKSFKPFVSASKTLNLGRYDSLWSGVYLDSSSSSALNKTGVVFCDSSGYIVNAIGGSTGGIGIYSSGKIFLRGGCGKSTKVDTALTSSGTGIELNTTGAMTITVSGSSLPAPITTNSSTVCTGLNAQLWNGYKIVVGSTGSDSNTIYIVT